MWNGLTLFDGEEGVVQREKRSIATRFGHRTYDIANFPVGCGNEHAGNVLREPVAGFELAAEDFRLVDVDAGVAVGPAQVEIRSERKRDRFSIDFGLNGYSLRRSWHRKIQRPAELHGIRRAHHV